MNLGLREFVGTNANIEADDNIQIAYESYVDWEAKGGRELQLGANLLTNKQLFWLATARRMFGKYHPKAPVSLDSINRLQDKYLHVFLKSKKGFQEAFECAMTKDEEKIFHDYENNFNKLFTQFGVFG